MCVCAHVCTYYYTKKLKYTICIHTRMSTCYNIVKSNTQLYNIVNYSTIEKCQQYACHMCTIFDAMCGKFWTKLDIYIYIYITVCVYFIVYIYTQTPISWRQLTACNLQK